MDSTLSSIKRFLGKSTCVTDNAVFRFHYQGTSLVLLLFSVIVTSKQYLGDPIDCITSADIPTNILDTFCWVHSTFSVPAAWNKTMGEEIPYPGVDKFVEGEKRVYHVYYQWVCFLLFFQSMMFFAPHYLWCMCEGGYVKQLSGDLSSPILREETKTERKRLLAQYIVASFGQHNFYAFEHFFCELFNLGNVVGQIFLNDVFLGGQFLRYGIDVIQFTGWSPSVTYDPMIKVFPRITKCTFRKFGSSGTVERHDTLCILPINIMNEKIYIFMWFWFMILAAVSFLAVMYRIVLLLFPSLRHYAMWQRAPLVKKEHLNAVLGRCQIGDWFLLYLISKNLDTLHFRDLIGEITKNLNKIRNCEIHLVRFGRRVRHDVTKEQSEVAYT